MTDFHAPKPVRKCACGADCEWCIVANRARRWAPHMRQPPKHDGDDEHECLTCFLKRDDLVVMTCNVEEPNQ